MNKARPGLPWIPMARMTGRRLLFAVPVLLAVTFAVFAVADASPFDPVKAYAGTAGLTASQENLDQLRANLGVDQPLAVRWWEWITGALTGDLGHSAVMRQPVADVIAERIGWSVLLAALAFVVAVLAGTTLGVLAARRRGSSSTGPSPPSRTPWRPRPPSGSACSPSGSSPSSSAGSRPAASPTPAAPPSPPGSSPPT